MSLSEKVSLLTKGHFLDTLYSGRFSMNIEKNSDRNNAITLYEKSDLSNIINLEMLENFDTLGNHVSVKLRYDLKTKNADCQTVSYRHKVSLCEQVYFAHI